MTIAGALDDYLEQLLSDALPDTPVHAPAAATAPASVAAQDGEQAEDVALAISAEFAHHALTAADPGTAPDPGDAETASAAPGFDSPTAAGSPANLALLDELMNDPALGPPAAAAVAHATPTSPGSPANLALLDELMNDPALGPPDVAVAVATHATPTSPGSPANLALLDELMNDPALGPPAAAPVIAARPLPAPLARAMPPSMPMSAPSARIAAPAHTRPGSWQELQAQARNPASSPRENRRAAERTSRWLRLRCGAQAYALELLKVQEVVLPVPLLPLRGTAEAMLGIMNLRGQVVPVMDLGIHLGAGPAQEDANTRIVVLEEDGETMGLRVSAVEDVANLTDSQIEPPDTARICQISNDLFRGVARVTAQPMILLDATQLLN